MEDSHSAENAQNRDVFLSPILIGIKGSCKSWLQTSQKNGEGGLPVWLKNNFPLLTKPLCTRIRPLAQYCFIFMYGTIITLGLLANVAVLVAFASKKVPFLIIIIFFTRKASQVLRKLPYTSYLESQVSMSDLSVLSLISDLSVPTARAAKNSAESWKGMSCWR